MEQIVLSPIPLNQLIDSIRSIVKEELLAKQTQDAGERLLSASEARKLFQPAVSHSTFLRWVDDGHIPAHTIGSKVYYKQSDVLASTKILKKYKGAA